MAEIRNKKLIAVLYHADCPDGFGAAWAAWRKFGDSALYLPVRHNDPPPEEANGKAVYMVDFCYDEKVTKAVTASVKDLVVVDHHISRKEIVKSLPGGVYSSSHSGAVLSWKYFHPEKKMPKLLRHIEDMDLWRFRLADTREFVEFINSYDFNFALWSKIARGCERSKTFKTYITEGRALIRHVNKEAEKALKSAEEIKFEGYKCLAANSLSHHSYIAHRLLEERPPIAVVWARQGNKVKVSLRSDGTVDVAKLAQRYGGGGHRAAAGFSFKAKHFLDFRKMKKIVN